MPVRSSDDQRLAAAVRPEVENRIRSLLVEHLGVDAEQLAGHVSLVDDLAADSLDLVEIELAIEANLGVILPGRFLADVRTCADLVDATVALVRERRTIRGEDDEPTVPLRARITPAGPAPGWVVERVILLTPDAA